MNVAKVIPIESVGVTYYTVTIGSLGIKVFNGEADALVLCNALNAQIDPAVADAIKEERVRLMDRFRARAEKMEDDTVRTLLLLEAAAIDDESAEGDE